jgi:hypothetical protein
MKGFTRKRLIPSLAASVMVAAATFAPLPSFLASGSVAHAKTALPRNFVYIESPATFMMSTPSSGATTSIVKVKVKYRCAPPYNQTASQGSIILTLMQPNTLIARSTTTENLVPSPTITCNDAVQETDLTVTATTNGTSPSLGAGQASVIALLLNSSNNTVADAISCIYIE